MSTIQLDDNLCLRYIECTDFDKGYLPLMNQLSSVDPDKITKSQFCTFVNDLSSKHKVIVIEDMTKNKIIASMTMLLEDKLIHNMGRVAHVEDVVVDTSYRNRSLGKRFIEHALGVAQTNQCYKIILDCSCENMTFYEKCGLSCKGVQMSTYF